MEKHFVYIIRSESIANKHYIGHTNNIEDRLKRHNENRNKYTKGKGPWEIVIFKEVETKKEAYNLEMKLKGFKNPEYSIYYLSQLD